MTTSPLERRQILDEVHTLATEDLVTLWRTASTSDLESAAFRQLIVEAYPELAQQWSGVGADLSAQWYNESAPELSYRASPITASSVDELTHNALWSLGATGEDGLGRLSMILQRTIWGDVRSTIVGNIRQEQGSRWARYASSTACAFCRVMSTRGAVYSTEGAATTVGAERWDIWRNYKGQRRGGDIGRRGRVRGSQEVKASYHNSCRCLAVEVRPGHSYEPPPYAEKWTEEYIDASRAVSPGAGAGDLNAILAHMRANTSATR